MARRAKGLPARQRASSAVLDAYRYAWGVNGTCAVVKLKDGRYRATPLPLTRVITVHAIVAVA